MTTHAVLATLGEAGVTLFVEDGRLRYRAEPGVYTAALRQLVAEHRQELLASVAPVPAWDTARADAILAQVNHLLDHALLPGGPADTPLRKGVVEVLRTVVVNLHTQRDPLLCTQALPWVKDRLRHLVVDLCGDGEEPD